jgi:TRAP-type C4-dicarboxylate transport system permease small subunit
VRRGAAVWLQRARRALWRLEDGLLAALLLALVLLASAQVLQRWLLADGWSGAEPASRLLVLWIAVLGALAATREGRHVAIDALPRLLPARPRRVLWTLGQAFAALFCAAVAVYSAELVMLEREAPVLLFAGLSSWVAMLVLPLAFGLMALRFALSALLPPPPLAEP